MKKCRRILSLLMSLVMVIAMFAGVDISALAEDGDILNYLSWSVNEGEITITGSATSIISEVVIPDTIEGYPVTAIGKEAFKNRDNIVSLTMTDNIISIGQDAFYDCDNLVYCDVSVNLETIAHGAFEYCEKLAYFYMPDTVTSIDTYAFRECTSLSFVSLSSGLTSIPDYAFYKCTSLDNIIIPDSVTTIGVYVFGNCTKLKDVTLSKSLKTLGKNAFRSTAIESIEIPKSLKDCGSASYTNYTFNGVTYSLSYGPFGFCENLKTVTFEKGTTRIADHLFTGCVGLEEIEIPDTVTIIEEYAFKDCLRLSSVKIGNAVTNIEKYAFRRCVSLKDVNLPKTLTTLGYNAFRETAIESIEIPKSLEDCGGASQDNYTFNGVTYSLSYGPFGFCENLKTVTFEKGTTRIADNLFLGCVGLEEIVIPDTVTVIEERAFEDCLRLSSVEIGSAVTVIERNAFSQCVSLPEITIPDSVTTIGDSAFGYCTNIKDVTLSKTLTTLGYNAFRETAIESIEIPKSLEDCGGASQDNYTFNGVTYSLSYGPFGFCENLKTVTFEKGTTRIADNLFLGCVGLEEIVIPDTVTVIEERAFEDCLRLSSVEIGSAVTVIEKNAFNQCVSLPEIIIPDSVTGMGTYVFGNCKALESVKLPDIRVNIMTGTFQNCSSLKTIELPQTVENIANSAFSGCTSLRSVSFHSKSALKTIGESAFFNCSALEYVILPEKTSEIGQYAFKNCVALEEVYIPQSVKTIGTEAFYGCEMLADIEISDYSITEIKANTFMNIHALESVVLPKGLKTIGSQAFKNDTSLVSVTIPESVTSIAANAFSYPDKTTIYGRTGSYAETFAKENGFKFVDNAIPAEGFALADADYIVLDRGESYRAEFEFYPANSNDVVTLSANNKCVTINGLDIKASSTGDSVITATTSSGLTYDFTVHVRDASKIEIASWPVKTMYVLGERFDDDGLEVKVVYSDKTERIIDDYKIKGFDSSVEGECTVTIEWTSAAGSVYKTTLKTTVVDTRPKLTGIYVAQLPDKTSYNLREPLDLTGLIVKATYNDSSEQILSTKAFTIAGFNNLKKGDQTLTVTYEGFTAQFVVNVGSTCIHQVTELRNAFPATCMDDGYSGDVYCADCGLLIEYGKIIESTGEHYYVSAVTKVATCDERGIITYTCTACKDWYEDDTGYDYDNHAYDTELLYAEEATCDDEGYTGDLYCTGCYELLEEGKVIPATGKHNYVKEVRYVPTCCETGRTEYTCTVCYDWYYEETDIDPDNHEGETEIIGDYEASCGAAGYTGDICCIDCGAVIESGKVIPSTGEHYYWIETANVESTCSTQGYVIMSCDCGAQEKTFLEIDEDNHENVVIVNAVAPTCTNDGYTEGRYCSVCDTLIAGQDVIEALGHNIVITPDDEPTCTQDGFTQGSYCTRCDDVNVPQEVIPATGHNIVVIAGSEPTCTELGYTEGSYCTNCSAMNVLQQIIPATGHDFSTEIESSDATCCRLGYVVMACDCGATEKIYSELDSDNHENIIVVNAIEPTCTNAGLTEGSYCSVCESVVEKQTVIPALGHEWNDAVCDRCGAADGINAYDVSVTIGDVSGIPGDSVDVYISVDEEVEVKSMAIYDIVYDSEKLTLVNGKWLDDRAVIAEWTQSAEIGAITFGENTKISGNVLMLTFEIAEDVEDAETEIGCVFKITTQEADGSEKALATEVIPGVVSIANAVKGDVSGDGVINSNDAIHLLYYSLIPDRYEVNQNCDFDGDGHVNSNDAIYLLYHTLIPDRYPL